MKKKKALTICDLKLKADKIYDKGSSRRFGDDIIDTTLDDLYNIICKMTKMADKMEKRMREYYEAIIKLGFVRNKMKQENK